MKLKNKVAIVTGANDGLGKQVALKLAKEKVLLALIARDEDRLSQVKAECEKSGCPKAEVYSCDISDGEMVKETVKQIEADFNEVQILLNIAGIWQKLNQTDQISDEEIDEVIDINLKGLIRITKTTLPILRRQKESLILNVSSHSGIAAKPGQAVYAASKWGVTGFTAVLREDLKETNIRVAGLYQGGVQTKLFEKAGDPKEPGKFRKFTKPDDLANVIVFMLSRPPQTWLYDVRVEY